MGTAYVLVVVKNYDVTVLAIKMPIDGIPSPGEEILVDFDDPQTEFVGGKWSEKEALGKYLFTVYEVKQLDELNKLPIVVCLALGDDKET